MVCPSYDGTKGGIKADILQDDIEEVVLADDDCEHEAATPLLQRSTSAHSRSKQAQDDDTSISLMARYF